MSMGPSTDLASLFAPYADEVVDFRRDLHAHPETGHHEVRTTARIAERLRSAGLTPQFLPGTGLMCDLGPQGPAVLLRADIDALPLQDESGLAFASTTPGVSHACGHDVHTSAVLGAGLVLADLERRGLLPGRVRLVFQPAEEVMPGGALDVIAAGGLDGVDRAFALHCDPSSDVGTVSLRPGPIPWAADHVLVRLHGSGGHTSRPHLTEDVVFALSQVALQLPAVLSRRLDPRAGVALVWGRIGAGCAANAIPRSGELEGTLRCLDQEVWSAAGALLTEVVHEVVRPYGVRADVLHTRGVPPTVNDPQAVLLAEHAIIGELGQGCVRM